MTDFASFDDFWSHVVTSTGELSSTAVNQLKAALSQIYDIRGENEFAAGIINGLDKPGGGTLTFVKANSELRNYGDSAHN
jgi:hypothetical protein